MPKYLIRARCVSICEYVVDLPEAHDTEDGEFWEEIYHGEEVNGEAVDIQKVDEDYQESEIIDVKEIG